MFIITNGSNVFAIAETEKDVKDWLTIRCNNLTKQYRPYGQSSYYTRQWPTANSFIASQLRATSIHKLEEVKGLLELQDYQTVRAISSNPDTNVTDQFFTMGSESVKIGEHITAQIVKKSLKSYGKTVVIKDKVSRKGNTVAPTPAEFKELYDQLARINCTVEGYGNITVAPDSLDQYKMTPQMQNIFTINFVE